MKHKVAVLVENNPGVLAKVANLFSRRGYNIDSLVVSDTEDKAISRMTIVVDGDERTIEQVTKQLHKLVDVIKVNDLTNDDTVCRQLLLVRVAAPPQWWPSHRCTRAAPLSVLPPGQKPNPRCSQ